MVEIDSSAAPIILLARRGGQGKDYSFQWEMAKGRTYIDGVALGPVSQPTLIYKEEGVLKCRLITKSGIWAALFTKGGPTADELESVFEQLERDDP